MTGPGPVAGPPADGPTTRAALAVLRGARIAVLTGAGVSTDSGIPDYRGPDSPPRTPMTYQQFVTDPVFRRHYWARNHVGWRRVEDTVPNAGHRALVRLEDAGLLTGLITQNVDRLHERAGARNVIDLHGSYLEVVCLSCGDRTTRAALATRLEELNPAFADTAEVADAETAPDADAVLATTEGFVVADCLRCGGILKPDIVYFGENVPKARVAAAFAMVDAADALLVAGSSLTVMSGLRFVRRAHRSGLPVVLVNRGPTRGDPLVTVKVDAGCSPTLTSFATGLLASRPTDGTRPGTMGPGRRPSTERGHG